MPADSTVARLESKSQRRREAKAWLGREKERLGCFRCGFKDPRVLDFHHVDRKSKCHNISDMVGQAFSIEAIEKEAAKCVLICANCHRIDHFKAPSHRARIKRRILLKKTRKRPPKLCFHKCSGRGFVTDPATRREIYFGKWGLVSTVKAYERWAQHFMETHMLPRADLPKASRSLALAERDAFGRVYQIACRLLKEEDRKAATRQELARAIADLEMLWK